MAKEYRVVTETELHPYIEKVFNEPGLSWREAKKQLRAWYLAEASKIRSIREGTYFNHD